MDDYSIIYTTPSFFFYYIFFNLMYMESVVTTRTRSPWHHHHRWLPPTSDVSPAITTTGRHRTHPPIALSLSLSFSLLPLSHYPTASRHTSSVYRRPLALLASCATPCQVSVATFWLLVVPHDTISSFTT